MTSLVKEIDAATAKNKNLKSFVVVLSDDEDAPDRLKALAEKNKIKQTVLAVDNVAGPKGYEIAKEAEVTVILYNKRKIEANHAFGKGKVNQKAIQRVVKDIPKIVSE